MESKLSAPYLDLLSEIIAKAPTTSSDSSLYSVEHLELLRALVMNPPQEIVKGGCLEELQSLASHIVWDVFLSFDRSKYSEVFLSHTEFGQRIHSDLWPMRKWSYLYSLLPDKKSIEEKDTGYFDELLTSLVEFLRKIRKDLVKELEIIREGIKDFRIMFFKEFVSLNSEIRPFIDTYGPRLQKTSMLGVRLRISRTLSSEVYGLLRRYYEARVEEVKPSEMYFPRTGHLGYVEHLVQNLKELVKAKADSLGLLKPYILQLQEMLQERLQLLSSGLVEDEEYVRYHMREIARLSYEAEFAIDSFLIGDVRSWFCVFWLRDDILEKLQTDMQQVKRELGDPQLLVRSIKKLAWRNDIKVFPILVSNTNISEKLREVFRDPDIHRQFEIRSWCLVSSYKERKKEVLRELLGNASYRHQGDVPKLVKKAYTCDMSVEELKQSVREILVSKDYLIILDDVPDLDALNDISRTLLTTPNCTILVTTPSAKLAAMCRDGLPIFSYREKSRDDSSTSQANKPTPDGDVVGFEAETKRMLDQLTGEPEELNIISVVGMGGQGKTTLAKKLYSHPSIVNRFNVRAWCSISQVYKKRELLMKLLGQVGKPFDTIHDKNDAELAHMLRKSLSGQRFLIVLDDIWSIGAWDDLQKCFPNGNNGSRIIFTTRLQQLASQVKSSSMLQPLGLLSIGESLELLRKKVSCPPELLGIARQIVEHCKGLPISIVLVAGLLEKIEKREDQWKKIAESLSSQILGDAKELGEDVIYLSYKHLPDHLKSCFLYLGAFLEDKEVPVSKLIRLWVAEGFIKHAELESLEDVAEAYVMDLISRSLVTVAQKKSSNRVKSCLVHDLVRDFCLAKARKENFMELIHGYDKYFPSSSNDVDYGIDPNYSCSSEPIRYSLRRLCISSKRNHFVMLKPFGPFVRSLLFFAANDMCPNFSYDISFISHNFKLLRILDLEDINIGDSFKAVEVLDHLRYLAIQGYIDFVPSSIANLWNLETFLVRGLRSKAVKVSNSIWDITKLRHVHINDIASFDLDPLKLENSKLDNLQSFSTPSLSYGDDMEKIMRKIIPGIQKLKCIFLDSWDDTKNCNQFPDLEFLSKLLSLKVLYNGDGKCPCKFSFPSNLKRLSLSKFHMSWNEISQLAILPELEVLKLREIVFEGEKWDMEDDVVFQELKFLKLDTMNIVKWSVSNENFPCLERLFLHKCDQLEEIPQSVGDIDTLEMIRVMWCNPSVATSARLIEDDQREYGKELKVHILSKVSDFESSSSNE